MKNGFVWLITVLTILLSTICIIIPSVHNHSNGFAENIFSGIVFNIILIYIGFLLLLLVASFSIYESFFKQVLFQIIISLVIIFSAIVLAGILTTKEKENFQNYAKLDKIYKFEKLYNVGSYKLLAYFKNKTIDNYYLAIDSTSNNEFTLLQYRKKYLKINDTIHYIGIPKGDYNCSRLIILGAVIKNDSLSSDTILENTFNIFSPYYP